MGGCYPHPHFKERRFVAVRQLAGHCVAGCGRQGLGECPSEKAAGIRRGISPESQCGFRRGRGCSDMIFTVRQLMEKSIEHQARGIFVFIDLKKAYDSVPTECLWQVLGRAGVPEKLINIVRSFHDPMSASVQFNNILSDPFCIGNGLREGCSMAPVLFNIFYVGRDDPMATRELTGLASTYAQHTAAIYTVNPAMATNTIA